jgi:hypothetical protein
MDHDFAPVVSDHGDNLQEVPGPVRAEVQHLSVVLLTGSECLLDRVSDVRIGDPVLAGRREDLHVANIVSRNSAAERARGPVSLRGTCTGDSPSAPLFLSPKGANRWRSRWNRGPARQGVECVGHLVLRTMQQMPVAVQHGDHRRVAGAGGDLGRRGAGGDPEGDRGVSKIVHPQRGEGLPRAAPAARTGDATEPGAPALPVVP